MEENQLVTIGTEPEYAVSQAAAWHQRLRKHLGGDVGDLLLTG